MKNIIDNFYENVCAEETRLSRKAGKVEFLTTMKYLLQYCKAENTILDACAGTGVYAFPLADHGCTVVCGDLVKTNVDKIKDQQSKKPIIKSIYEGSATDLSRFSDQSFDVVLNFGAYYHLIDKKERDKSI